MERARSSITWSLVYREVGCHPEQVRHGAIHSVGHNLDVANIDFDHIRALQRNVVNTSFLDLFDIDQEEALTLVGSRTNDLHFGGIGRENGATSCCDSPRDGHM